MTKPMASSVANPVEIAPDRPTNRIDALLVLRGLACLVVVIAHCQPPLAALAETGWGWLLAMPGGIAVRVFFTLSGYLIAKGFYLRRYALTPVGLGRYLRNRAARLIPLYLAAIAIPALALAPSIFTPAPDNDWVLLRYLTFTYNHTLPERFNPTLWALSTEVQFYAIAPLLFWLVRGLKILKTMRRALVAVVVTLVVWFGLREAIVAFLLDLHGGRTASFQLDFIRYVYTLLAANLDAFACGMLLNPIAAAWKPDRRTQRLAQGAAIAAIALLFIRCTTWKVAGSLAILSIGPTLTIVAVCLFIVAFEAGDAYLGFRQNRHLSVAACKGNPWRALEVSGVLSYGLYVWHYPISIGVLPHFDKLETTQAIAAFLLQAGAVLGLSTLAAIATRFAIELPGLAYLKAR
ncbi:MAG: acyltransferase family protein [Geitlerinemataceae cyanobacterium]